VNVGTYLLLTVPLVGGSLYLYDSLRGPAPAQEAPPVATPPPREVVREVERPVLQGDPTSMTERQVRDLIERLLAEKRAEGAGTTGVVPGTSGDAAPLPFAPPIDLGGDPDSLTGPAAQFDEKTLTVFRAYLQEAQRLERVERQTQMVNSQLDALGVSLSQSQRQAVVDATVKHQQNVRDTFRQLPGGAEARDARQKAVTELREAYNKTIYDLVPISEAEKIVKGMGGAWRGDGGLPGMANRVGGGRTTNPGSGEGGGR
jgi:hypothetical protein